MYFFLQFAQSYHIILFVAKKSEGGPRVEDFVVKYITYLVCIALAGWSFFMFLAMLSNCIRMGRKNPDPDEKLSAFMIRCKVETVLYLVIPVICVAVAYMIHIKYNT